MRDVRVKAHVAPGLRVKIVQPKDEEAGLTTEGVVKEVLSTEEFDEGGVLVRLETGEEGRLLRIWEHGAPPVEEPRKAPPLPTYADPPPPPKHRAYRIPQAELDKLVKQHLGKTPGHDLAKLIARHEEGLTGSDLKRYGITGEELEEKSKDLLAGVDDRELERRMARRKNRPG